MTYKDFCQKVSYNTSMLRKALDKNESLSTLLDKVYTYDYEPGELHFSQLLRNGHDIIPSLFLGALANIDANGVDGYRVLENGELEPLEFKTAEVASSKVWKGVKGGLYTGLGKGTRRTALSSKLQASYHLHTHENLLSKNMKTILLITDTDGHNTYIDAWEMDGQDVIKYLQLSENAYRAIKLGSFMLWGEQSKTTVPLEGYQSFKNRLENTALLYNDFFNI